MKQYIRITITLLYLSFLICCSEMKMNTHLIIETETILEDVPSGSGIVIKKEIAYIFSDDGTGVYQLNLLNQQHNKIAILGMAYDVYREEKAVKHDFESATLVNWDGKEYLLALGSGSKENARDSMLMLNTLDFKDNRIVSLHNIYKQLRQLTNTGTEHWNIEGATTIEDELVLLNRGNNLLIRINKNDLLSYISDSSTPFPEIKYHRVKLPSIGDHEARLSGACTLDSSHILFSASVEDTPDWISDGPVLGSFIGVYSLQSGKVIASHLLQDGRGNVQKEKLEAVDILRKEANGDIILLALSDNDNGTSKLFQLRLKIPR